jgi:lipopolysaccharide/colanic/teichoic acid biosynthesis glycosyltransferase
MKNEAKSHKTGVIYAKFIKRLIDFIMSLTALIMLSPILLLVAILVRVKLGSPIIFKQDRPGLNEKIFTMYKFRTMTDVRNENGELLPDNIRLTKFGKFLRSTSLDELPELWNIVCGDMGIVGPRPLVPEYLPYYTDEERHRHDIRPGLTGLAQIRGRSYLSWEQRFELDNLYVQNCSFILDCKIVISTILQVLKRSSVVNVEEVKVDEIGEYFTHEGRVFRRLNEERSDKKIV